MNVNKFINDNRLHSTEGVKGLKNLCKIVRKLGYKDPFNQFQFPDGCYGDLFVFLEDNSGAIEVLVEWIKENHSEDESENEG
jgi:aromatic ring-cleaving dioxygenase